MMCGASGGGKGDKRGGSAWQLTYKAAGVVSGKLLDPGQISGTVLRGHDAIEAVLDGSDHNGAGVVDGVDEKGGNGTVNIILAVGAVGCGVKHLGTGRNATRRGWRGCLVLGGLKCGIFGYATVAGILGMEWMQCECTTGRKMGKAKAGRRGEEEGGLRCLGSLPEHRKPRAVLLLVADGGFGIRGAAAALYSAPRLVVAAGKSWADKDGRRRRRRR